ncbi:MAG: CehA/McbA family metallohydrolase [Planctomycetota bacterium]
MRRGLGNTALLFALAASAACGTGGSSGSGKAGSTIAPATSTTPTAPVASSTTTSPVTPPAPPTPRAGTWLKGDFHVHSNHSGDATWGDDITGVIRAAETNGLDFISISDHRQATCLTDPQFTNATTKLVLIPGEEWGGPGHAGAHGLTRDPIYHEQDTSQGPGPCVKKIQQAIDDVTAMGGVFVINHPIDAKNPWFWPVERFQGMEVWNQQWALGAAADSTPADLASWAAAKGLDVPGAPATPPEAHQALTATGGGQNWQRLKFYEAYLSSGHHISAIGGGDTHYLFLPGWPTTVVFAETNTKAGVLEGVRKGRTIVQRAPDAPPLEFTADPGNTGNFHAMIGDSIKIGQPVTFKVRVKDNQGGKVQLVKNGTIVQDWPVTSTDFTVTYTDTPTGKSWYRVNMLEPLDTTLPNTKLLKDLILGVQSAPWLQQIIGLGILGSLGQKITTALNSGVPTLAWLLIYGQQAGVRVSAQGSTNYPRLEIPPAVSRWMNMAVHDDAYAMGAVTSPIWVE